MRLFPGTPAVGFDGTIAELPSAAPGLTYVQKNVGDVNSDTLTDLTEYFEGKSNVFLKLDIEGCEFQVMPHLIRTGLMSKVKQLVLEIHTPCDIQRFPDYYAAFLQTVTDTDMFDMLSELKTTHTIVHFHGNNVWHTEYPDHIVEGVVLPFVFELTMVRNEFVPTRVPSTVPLPTSQDRKNTRRWPDYTLDGWPFCTTV
jgi:hypothetical protein